MPQGKRRSGAGYNGNTAEIMKIRGHNLSILVTEADPSGAQRFRLHPANVDNTRLADFCAVYEEFTWAKLKVTFCRGDGVGMTIAAYTPCTASSSASNSIVLGSIDQMAVCFPGQTTPATVRIPRLPLHGPKDWYECSDTNDGPGDFWFSNLSETGTGVGGTGIVRFDYEIHFCGRIPTGVTLDKLRALARRKDKDDDTFSTSSSETVTLKRSKSRSVSARK